MHKYGIFYTKNESLFELKNLSVQWNFSNSKNTAVF